MSFHQWHKMCFGGQIVLIPVLQHQTLNERAPQLSVVLILECPDNVSMVGMMLAGDYSQIPPISLSPEP